MHLPVDTLNVHIHRMNSCSEKQNVSDAALVTLKISSQINSIAGTENK